MSDGYTYTTISARPGEPAGSGWPSTSTSRLDHRARHRRRPAAPAHRARRGIGVDQPARRDGHRRGRGDRAAAGRPGRGVRGGDRALTTSRPTAPGQPRRDRSRAGRPGAGTFRPSLVSPHVWQARKRGDSSYARPCAVASSIAQVDNADPFTAPVWRSPVLPHPRMGDLARPARPPAGPGDLVR